MDAVSSQSKGRRPSRQDQDLQRRKAWTKPLFRNLRLGFEITMYFWTK